MTSPQTTSSSLVVNDSYPTSQVKKQTSTQNNSYRSSTRQWISQPRTEKDLTWEIISINLRRPILITDISFALMQRSQAYEVWYTDEDKNINPLITDNANQVAGVIGGSGSVGNPAAIQISWQNVAFSLRPTIIMNLMIKVQRVPVGVTGAFSLGVKDILMKREVSSLNDTLFPSGQTTDILGNSVTKDTQIWYPENAIKSGYDLTDTSYWKSAPQPSPNAVVNYYLAVNGLNSSATIPAGGATIDSFYLDPLYPGASFNLYYSNLNTTEDIYRPRPTVVPVVNTYEFDADGLDISTENGLLSLGGNIISPGGYPSNTWSGGLLGGLSGQTPGSFGWFGEWFTFGNDIADSTADPITICHGQNAFLITYDPSDQTFNVVTYGASESEIVKSFKSDAFQVYPGTECQVVLSCNVTPSITSEYRFIVALSNKKIIDETLSISPANLNATFISLYQPGGIQITNDPDKLGHLKGMILKANVQGDYEYNSFISNPMAYLQPQPSISQTLSDSLDYALYVGTFFNGNVGYGGLGSEFFTGKTWTPVNQDFTLQKGIYTLEQPITAAYLKFEFFGLTSQPYQINDPDIEIPYQVFPNYVLVGSQAVQSNITNLASQTGGLPRPKFAPNSPNISASDDVLRRIAPKAQVFVSSQVVNGIKNQNLYDPKSVLSEQVILTKTRTTTTNDSVTLASSVIKTIQNTNSRSNKKLVAAPNAAKTLTLSSNVSTPAIGNNTSSSSLGLRSPGWWTLPGGLRLPQAMMENLTNSSTVTEKKSSSSETSTTQPRFVNTSIHRYDIKSAKRDAGIAYFVGLRNVKLFRDKSSTDFSTLTAQTYTKTPASITTRIVSSSNSLFDESYTVASTGFFNINMHTDINTGNIVWTTSPLAGGSGHSLTQNAIGTATPFREFYFECVERGTYSKTAGQALQPFGAGSIVATAFWNDPISDWNDSVAVWGSNASLIGIDYTPNFYFQGQQAIKLVRSGETGAAGLTTAAFSCVSGTRIRVKANVFRQNVTTNDVIIQLVDTTPSTGGVVQEWNVPVSFGSWQPITTTYFTLSKAYPNLAIRFLVNGTQKETLYVTSVSDDIRTLIYEVRDGSAFLSGVTTTPWYDISEIINNPNAYFTLPNPLGANATKNGTYEVVNHTLKVYDQTVPFMQLRMTFLDLADYISSYKITPNYRYI